MNSDRTSARPHLAHEVEDLGGLGQRKRRGRLVENDQLRLFVDGASNRHPLALAARKLADDRCGVNTLEVKPISRISARLHALSKN